MICMLTGSRMPHKPLGTTRPIKGAVFLFLMSCAVAVMPTGAPGATEPREEDAPRSSVYKGEVVVHEATKLVMTDSNGQRIELHLGPDTFIQGRRGAPFRPGDLIEADVTPEGHVKSIRPVR